MKQCTKCKEVKELTEFYNKASYKDGKDYYCKECKRESNRASGLMHRYGITLDEYYIMLDKQDSKCLICSIELETDYSNRNGNKAVVDHCHGKGHVRGILCSDCNLGLGYFHDNTDSLKKAIEYLNEK